MFPAKPLLKILPLSDLHLPKPSASMILGHRSHLDAMDLVVLMGDMVMCYGTDREYGAALEFARDLKRPFVPLMGNHEWYFQLFEENSGRYGEVWDEASREEKLAAQRRFARFWNLEVPWRATKHQLGHFVFLSLDNCETEKQESLSAPQLRFLAEQIEIAQNKPIFVFCHAPLMLDCRLDMTYYDDSRSGCVELTGKLRKQLQTRAAPTFWMSGHVHLRPDHYLFSPYQCGGNVWQIHCPDSWGYGRWERQQRVPQRYEGLFSRFLEIDETGVSFVAFDWREGREIGRERVEF